MSKPLTKREIKAARSRPYGIITPYSTERWLATIEAREEEQQYASDLLAISASEIRGLKEQLMDIAKICVDSYKGTPDEKDGYLDDIMEATGITAKEAQDDESR